MSDDELQTSESVPISWRAFLETCSPMRPALIESSTEVENGLARINTPPIMLFCENIDCKKEQYSDVAGHSYAYQMEGGIFLKYTCRHCRHEKKFYSVLGLSNIQNGLPNTGFAIKLGELPSFGPPTPNRLLRLFGDDSVVFLKGRQCENQGLGVGAFAYYRRVVENHKNQLIQEIAKVAKRLGAEESTLALFYKAINEISFEKSIDSIKDAVPKELMIQSHNPLLLLHGALSQGLHDGTDEECLEHAHAVRVILTELTERIGLLLKEEQELKQAVGRLPKVRQTASPKQITGP